MPNTMYCRKDINEKGQPTYSNFFEGIMQVRMCGTPQNKIVQIVIEEAPEPTNDTQWGFKDFTTDTIDFIYPDKEMVQMCSTDSFKQEIKEGTGNIIPLTIKEL